MPAIEFELTESAWSDLGDGPLLVWARSAGVFFYVADGAAPPPLAAPARAAEYGGTFGLAGSRVFARARRSSVVVLVSPAPVSDLPAGVGEARGIIDTSIDAAGYLTIAFSDGTSRRLGPLANVSLQSAQNPGARLMVDPVSGDVFQVEDEV